MRSFLHSRLLRCIVCFCLICCFLINCSPIRTEATAIGATVATGSAAAGILGLLFSMSMGVVFVELTADKIVSVGENLSAFLADYFADDQETSNSVTGYLNDLTYSFGGSGDDGTGNGDNDNKITLMPDAIAAGFVAWILHMYKNGGFSAFSGAEAPEGYAYYNGFLLPEIPLDNLTNYASSAKDTYPNVILLEYYNQAADLSYSFSSYHVFYSKNIDAYYANSSVPEGGYFQYDCPMLDLRLEGNVWKYSSIENYGSNAKYYRSIPIWSNVDILGSENNLILAGSEPTSKATIFVEPDIYVGDIPQQIEEGSYDEDDLKLPYINHGNLFGNHTNYVDALNDVSTQLKDGSMTYDQYMDQIQTESEGDSSDNSGSSDGTGEDSGGNSGGSSGPVDSMLPYALDLTDFFPFCIPFDLYDLYSTLAAAPETPVFDLNIAGYTVTVDLSPWDDFAAYFRRLQLLLFVIGLAASSRKFISW